MTDTTDRRLTLADQVHDLLLDRAARLADLIGGPDLRAQLERLVEANHPTIVGRLMVGNDREVANLVADLFTLAHGDSQPSPEWWQTPLGGVVARSLEHDDSDAISPLVAARMLGIAETTVHRWVRAGKLDRHPDGGVTRASVMARIGGG